MVVIAAGTKRDDGAAEAVDRGTAQTPADAPARTMTATGSTMRGLEMRPRKREKRFLRRGAFWWVVAPAVLDEPPPPRAVRRRSMPVRSPARGWRPRLLPVSSFMPMYRLGGRPRSAAGSQGLGPPGPWPLLGRLLASPVPRAMATTPSTAASGATSAMKSEDVRLPRASSAPAN